MKKSVNNNPGSAHYFSDNDRISRNLLTVSGVFGVFHYQVWIGAV